MVVEAPVTYVRHAMAVPDETVHPSEWVLDAKGRASAASLADRLEVGAGIGVLVSSTEPKALGTAAEIGRRWEVEVLTDARLREAVRPWVGPGYRAVVHRYLRGEAPDGWEPHLEVAARTAAAVREARQLAAGRPLVVVSHGLALSLHLGDQLGPDFEPEQFWSSLAFPDAWALDHSGVLHRPQLRLLRP